MLRVLLVGHSDIHSNYGAATSLRHHCEILSESKITFDLAYRKDLIQWLKNISFKKRKKNIENIRKLYHIWLPFNSSILESNKTKIIGRLLFEDIPNLFYNLNRGVNFRFLKSDPPNIIHLNSIVLYKLIPIIKKSNYLKKVKIIIHCRELVKPKLSTETIDILKSVDRIICIDQAVRDRLIKASNHSLHNTHVTNNPFFKTSIKSRKILDTNNCSKTTTFGVAGVISEEKGIQFIIESFLKARENNPNIQLVIAGKINSFAKSLFRANKKYLSASINWLGEINELNDTNFYQEIDYIIRGETTFCTGRTVYEALYNNSKAILPGNAINLQNDNFLKEFDTQVLFYEPRKINDLASLMQTLHKVKKDNTEIIQGDNINRYKSEFLGYYTF